MNTDTCDLPLAALPACDLAPILDRIVPDRPASPAPAYTVGAFNSYI